MHALAGAGVLVLAAAMNFAMYPDALAAVVSGERPIIGFVPDEPSSGTSAYAPVDEDDVRLLAATTWAEARGEGERGMRAVAHVIVNRVSERFGDNVETVVLAPKQFSAWNHNDPNRRLALDPEAYARSGAELESWRIAQQVAREVLSGQSVDPTGGALFYHTRAVRPRWARRAQGRRVIGAHVFYRDVIGRSRPRAPTIELVSASEAATSDLAAPPVSIVAEAPPVIEDAVVAGETSATSDAPISAAPAPTVQSAP